MKPGRFIHSSRAVVRGLLFAAVLLSLFIGSGSQTAQAITTGSISGTVYGSDGITPITGVSIGVQVREKNNPANTWSACTNPATGTYTISGIPLPKIVIVIADGGSFNFTVNACPFSKYGYELWKHATVTGTPITLNLLHPSKAGIDFTLAEAVPYIESLYFNVSGDRLLGEPTDGPIIRQAIAYGTNRQALLDSVWAPAGWAGTVQDSYVASNAFNAAARTDGLPGYDFNATTAENILQAAGWWVPSLSPDGIRYSDDGNTTTGTRLSLSFKTTDFALRTATGALFVSQMQAIGIEIIPSYLPSGAFFNNTTGPLATGNFDIAEYAYSNCAGIQDETCVPFSNFNTSDAGNYSHYSSSAADTDYNNAVANTAPGRAYWAKQHQIQVMTDLPTLPLFSRTTTSISGVIRKLDGTPLTGVKIRVDAVDATTGELLASTCTSSATGYYSLTGAMGLPAGRAVAVYAQGGSGTDYCNSNSTFYGWSFWNSTGDVTNLTEATSITLTGTLSPNVDFARDGIDLHLGEAVPGIEYLIFNTDASTNGILADKSVRQAIAYGTDRLHILNTAWLPNGIYGTVENSYVADNHWAKDPDTDPSLHKYPYDVTTAESLLDAAHWKVPSGSTAGIRYSNDGNTSTGVRLRLTYKTTVMAARQATGADFVTQMAAIGIEIVPTYYSGYDFFTNPAGPLQTHQFDIAEYTTGYCRDTLDEYCVPFAMYHNGDPGNNAHYNSAAADTEYNAFQLITGTDPTAHADRLTHAIAHQQIAMEDLPYFPLFTRETPLTIRGNAGVGGAKLSWMDGTLKTVTASSTGVYSITVPFDWSGTVTPSKTGRVFSPASRSYTKLTASRTNQNYVAKYIVTYRSAGAQDGWILETTRTSSLGGTFNSTDTTFPLGDDAKNRQYRAVLSFNTAGLPDTALVQSAVLGIESAGAPAGTDPFTVLGALRADIDNPFFGLSPSLEKLDFSAPPSAAAVASFGTTPSKGWYSAKLNATGNGLINKLGLTQFRLYFTLGDNNNLTADNMPFYSGNAGRAGAPTLTIIYTLP